MKLNRTLPILALVITASLVGCTQDADECSPALDADYCNHDATALRVCENGKWQTKPCNDAEICGYTSEGAQCVASSTAATCTPGTTLCISNMLQTCTETGLWTYKLCSGQCHNGTCPPDTSSPDTPSPDTPTPPALTGIVKFQCSDDKKSIETVMHDGTITSQSCIQAVGFDSECREYSNGLAGCERPETCNDVFSKTGTCHGNTRHWCDTQYMIPKPSSEDCSAQNKTCSIYHGKAECRDACHTPGALSCSKADDIEYITQCVNTDSNMLTQTAATICTSDKESASCQNGEIIKTSCPANTQCISDLGKCAETCSTAELGDIKCSDTGELFLCSSIASGHAYISVGMRHCDGNTRLSCKKNDDGSYTKTELDCTNYTDNNGNTVSGTCVTELQYYPDMDVCYYDPSSDGRCNGLKDAGTCHGSDLKYCDETSDNAYTIHCADNKTNTACSAYAGYADCRKPCSQAGKALCATLDGMTMLKICAPDDQSGTLTEIEGQAVCFGDELYTCDEAGNTQITNCAANGGICHINACAYPACTATPTCLADDAILACQVTSDGQIIGASLETIWCSPDGTCRTCDNGQIQ